MCAGIYRTHGMVCTTDCVNRSIDTQYPAAVYRLHNVDKVFGCRILENRKYALRENKTRKKKLPSKTKAVRIFDVYGTHRNQIPANIKYADTESFISHP